MPRHFPLRDQPAVALLIARLLAQRLNVATTYLATSCSNMPATAITRDGRRILRP